MNRTHLEHALYALAMQAVIGFAFGAWWAGAALAIGFFAGREHAQREYQITAGGPVNGLKPWQGFRGWSRDSVLDLAAPAVAVVVVALAATGVFA